MKVGYARVSTADQQLDLQINALNEAGCERIFTDKESGGSSQRLGLQEALQFLREGDVLVVWRLDRLGRSLTHLIEIMNTLGARHIGIQSLTEALDTTTASGRLVFQLFGMLAEFERHLIRERTRAGLQAARAQGKLTGRPRGLTVDQLRMARTMIEEHHTSVADVAAAFRVSSSTIYRGLRWLAQREASRSADT